ncbi:MAG: hypothetical protein AAB738_03615 [Patescibacteria group bacterium]
MNPAQELVRRKHLVWYTRDYDKLGDVSLVEAVLNYGDWEDVQELFKIMGIKRVAKIFNIHAFRDRTNYFPQIRNYFRLYFDKYAR